MKYDVRTMDRRLFAVLKAIAMFSARGFQPSMRELAGEVGISSSASLYYRLQKLLDRGLVEREANTARTVRLTPLGWRVLQEEGDTS